MPAPALPAATVILVRNGEVSPEVLLLERHAKSAFLPDMYVFPGGRVDPGDLELARRIGRDSRDRVRAALPELAAETALAFFAAAIRETFEESGILLAHQQGTDELVAPRLVARLARQRLRVQSGERSFEELCREEALELAAERLVVHAHWITPETLPQRFDTYFFSCLAPQGQLALHDGIESTDHVWIRPEDALDQARRGERRMIFPTLANLETLAGFEHAEQVLAASRARPVVPILPRIEDRDGERRFVIPEDAGYPSSEEPVSRIG